MTGNESVPFKYAPVKKNKDYKKGLDLARFSVKDVKLPMVKLSDPFHFCEYILPTFELKPQLKAGVKCTPAITSTV